MSVNDILSLKDLSMRNFETRVWDAIGQHNCKKEDQIKVSFRFRLFFSLDGFMYQFGAFKMINCLNKHYFVKQTIIQ